MGLMDFFKKGKEKPVETKKNQSNSGSVLNQDSKAAPTPAQQPQQPQQQYYTVKSGDSLSKIAQQYYGDAQQWKRIHQANLDQIKDPNLIHPGQKIVIPK